jgi:hypothetical protein
MAFADRIEHLAVLVAQDLLLLLVGEIAARNLLRVGSGAFSNAAATNEDLGLEDQFIFTGLTLHVIDRISLLHVGIKTKNHAVSICSTKND